MGGESGRGTASEQRIRDGAFIICAHISLRCGIEILAPWVKTWALAQPFVDTQLHIFQRRVNWLRATDTSSVRPPLFPEPIR